MDVVDRHTRSRMMSGIRGKNTKPELVVRSALHKLGYRFRLHYPGLPGKPDIVLPKHRAIILVHGCFWHGHDCHLFKWPASRPDFWRGKITGNMRRDKQRITAYRQAGWKTLIIWECSLKGKHRLPVEEVTNSAVEWLLHSDTDSCISGLPATNGQS